MQNKAQSITAVFGGSFNPLHQGHLGIIHALCEDAEIGQVLVIPNRHSPFKPAKENLPDAVRWDMLQRAIADLPKVRLCDLELRRPPPSYTHDTVTHLASVLPGAPLVLAMGWDAFAEFARWQKAADILSLAGLLVFHRPASSPPQPPMEQWPALLPAPWPERARVRAPHCLVAEGGRVLVRRQTLPLPDCSASAIRRGRSLDDVPPAARPVLERYWAGLDSGPAEGG